MKRLQKISLLAFLFSYALSLNAQVIPPPPPPPVDETVYDFAEEMPYLKIDSCADMSYQGKSHCSNVAIMNYLRANLRFSPTDLLMGNEGRVFVQFIINKNGKMEGFKILKNLTKSTFFEYEAQRVFIQLNKEMNWEPGKLKGKDVNIKINYPVPFRRP